MLAGPATAVGSFDIARDDLDGYDPADAGLGQSGRDNSGGASQAHVSVACPNPAHRADQRPQAGAVYESELAQVYDRSWVGHGDVDLVPKVGSGVELQPSPHLDGPGAGLEVSGPSVGVEPGGGGPHVIYGCPIEPRSGDR